MAEGTFVAGLVLGLSLAAPPGPINALIAAETVRGGFGRGFRTGLGAMAADAVFLVVTLAGAKLLLRTGDTVLGGVSLAGGLLMGYFAYGSWRAARDPAGRAPNVASFAGAFLIAITNPYQITWWLTSGLALLTTFGVAVVAGLFAGILVWITGFPMALLAGSRWRWFSNGVAYASAVILAGFALFFAWNGVGLLTGRA